MIRTANAPVSYGVFGLSREDLVPLPSGEELAAWVHEAGYGGIDLGAVGLLGTGDGLTDRLRRYGLGLAGGWVDLPFAGDDDSFTAALTELEGALDVFVTAADVTPQLPPKPTIACSGSPERKVRPGGAPELSLTGEAWGRYAARVQHVADRVRRRGLEPTFHHHACTYVETPAEIEALLADTDIDLTFDSGHLIIGGGDPLPDYLRWRERINHVHLKDADRSLLVAALSAGGDPVRNLWEKRVFVPLGDGDLEVDSLVDAIAEDFSGWLVVEQDVVLLEADDVARARAEQVANRERLRRWFP